MIFCKLCHFFLQFIDENIFKNIVSAPDRLYEDGIIAQESVEFERLLKAG
jgi:hypothetical protein